MRATGRKPCRHRGQQILYVKILCVFFSLLKGLVCFAVRVWWVCLVAFVVSMLCKPMSTSGGMSGRSLYAAAPQGRPGNLALSAANAGGAPVSLGRLAQVGLSEAAGRVADAAS